MKPLNFNLYTQKLIDYIRPSTAAQILTALCKGQIHCSDITGILTYIAQRRAAPRHMLFSGGRSFAKVWLGVPALILLSQAITRGGSNVAGP